MFKLRIRAFICAHIDMHYTVSTAVQRQIMCTMPDCSGLLRLRSRWDRRRADPFARLLFRDVVTKQARFMQWKTGTTQARQSIPRASVGLRSANSIQQARQRYNPGTRAIAEARCKQSLKNPKIHWQEIRKQEPRQHEMTRLETRD